MWCELRIRRLVLFISFAAIQAKDPELPLCPTNMQYFPQNLPMHCRLPATIAPFPSHIFQNPSLGKQSVPIPMSMPGIPGPLPGPIPGPIPGAMPLPMVPMAQAPAHKLPVIVMPFYSPDPSVKKPHVSHQNRLPKKHKVSGKKRRPKHYYNSEEDSVDTDSSTDDSSNASPERGWWKGRREGRRSNRHHKSKRKKNQNKDILTPILQYVTKDGYVIFEKQISKGEAKDWLVSKNENKNMADVVTSKKYDDHDSNEERGDKGGTKINLMKDVEVIEVGTETNLHQLPKKKSFKRKPIRKPIDD